MQARNTHRNRSIRKWGVRFAAILVGLVAAGGPAAIAEADAYVWALEVEYGEDFNGDGYIGKPPPPPPPGGGGGSMNL